jgi:hypothetical protein
MLSVSIPVAVEGKNGIAACSTEGVSVLLLIDSDGLGMEDVGIGFSLARSSVGIARGGGGCIESATFVLPVLSGACVSLLSFIKLCIESLGCDALLDICGMDDELAFSVLS